MKLAQYKLISKQISDDLDAVFKKHGLKLKPFGARVDEQMGIVKLSLELHDLAHKGADGKATTPERERFKEQAQWVGMKAEWLDAAITLGGRQFTVDGLRSKGKKIVCIKEAMTGKQFVTTPDDVIRHFAAKGDKVAQEKLKDFVLR